MSVLLHLIVMQKSMTKASHPVPYHPSVVDLDHVLRREDLASVACVSMIQSGRSRSFPFLSLFKDTHFHFNFGSFGTQTEEIEKIVKRHQLVFLTWTHVFFVVANSKRQKVS